MLMPKRVKHRKQFRGRMKGKAHRGNFLAYGEFGLQAMEPHWVTSQQIEAARIALTRYTKRGGQLFEVAGISEEIAREALRLASHKLPLKTKFIKKADEPTTEAGGEEA